MYIFLAGGLILGYCLGQCALRRHFINGVTGVLALLVILCFAFTTVIGWCGFVRYSQAGSMLFSSWAVLFFSAWAGLFAASLRDALMSLRTPLSAAEFSSLSDKYEIICDDPNRTGRVAPVLVPKAALEQTEPSDIKLPF